MKKIDFENKNSEKFTVLIDLENVNHRELQKLLNLTNDGHNKLSFIASHQNYEIEIEYLGNKMKVKQSDKAVLIQMIQKLTF